MSTADLDRLLTIDEVATYLRISKSALYTMRHEGRAPRGYRVGQQVRFRLSDVEAWLQEHADKPRR